MILIHYKLSCSLKFAPIQASTQAGIVDNDDIYIMMKWMFVCMSVTKNELFLALPPSAPI